MSLQNKKNRTTPIQQNKSDAAPSNVANSSTSTAPNGAAVNVENVKASAPPYRHFLLQSYGTADLVDSSETFWQKYLRDAYANFRSVIKEKEEKVAILPLEDAFRKSLKDCETMYRDYKHLEQNLLDIDVTLKSYLKRREEEDQELLIKVKQLWKEEMEQNELFEKEVSDYMETLERIEKKIDFESNLLDNNLINIRQLDKLSSDMNESLNSCRIENQEYTNEIKDRKQQIEQASSQLEVERSQWLTESTAALKGLKQEKDQLHERMTTYKSQIVEAEDEMKTLCEESVQLTTKDKKLAKRLAKIQAANRDLSENANSEPNQNLDQLSKELMSLQVELAQIKSKSKKERKQYKELKRITTKISETKENFNELRAAHDKLFAEVWQQDVDVSTLQILADNEVVDDSCDSSIKRRRLSCNGELSSESQSFQMDSSSDSDN